MKAAIITSSDSGYAGEREDKSGSVIQEILEANDYEVVHTILLPDDRKMLADEEINIPDELLAHLVSESAEDTKTAVEAFAKMYKDAVQAAVKDALKGNAPKGGSGGKGAVTKEQILDMLDAGQYKELIAENIALFQ